GGQVVVDIGLSVVSIVCGQKLREWLLPARDFSRDDADSTGKSIEFCPMSCFQSLLELAFAERSLGGPAELVEFLFELWCGVGLEFCPVALCRCNQGYRPSRVAMCYADLRKQFGVTDQASVVAGARQQTGAFEHESCGTREVTFSLQQRSESVKCLTLN